MICNDNEFKMLLRQIKSESYGMIRYNSLRPSLSAKSSMSKIVGLFFFYTTDFGLHSGICRIIVFLSLLSQTKIIEIFGMSLKSIVTLHQRLKKQFINLEI